MTLLEIMISIMVLSIGLLGAMALLPLGQYEMSEINKADRGSGLGRGGFRGLQASGALDTNNWLMFESANSFVGVLGDRSSTGVPAGAIFKSPGGSIVPPPMAPIVLDPLMMGLNVTNSAIKGFPYDLSGMGSDTTTITQLLRATLRAYPNTPSKIPLSAIGAEHLFRGRDDLIFEIPKSKADNPQSIFTPDGTGLKVSRQLAGNYTWFAVISPDYTEALDTPTPTDGTVAGNSGGVRQFMVAIVACYKRRLFDITSDPSATPGERMVWIDFQGGGDAQLRIENCENREQAERMLNVGTQQWIMVIGPDPLPGGYLSKGQTVVQWYRVLSAGDEPESSGSKTWFRTVRIVGPEWPFVSGGSPSPGYAVIIDGAVGVFERTISVDADPSF